MTDLLNYLRYSCDHYLIDFEKILNNLRYNCDNYLIDFEKNAFNVILLLKLPINVDRRHFETALLELYLNHDKKYELTMSYFEAIDNVSNTIDELTKADHLKIHPAYYTIESLDARCIISSVINNLIYHYNQNSKFMNE